jgi:hypothetical protein
MTAMMSTMMVIQQALKKAPVKPSGPDDLSLVVSSSAAFTSSSARERFIKPSKITLGLRNICPIKIGDDFLDVVMDDALSLVMLVYPSTSML